MSLYNSLTKQLEHFVPQKEDEISIYSCGPTVYERAHIGNLASFVYADTLRRTLRSAFPNYQPRHVMNITDVDDKTIAASREKYPNLEPMEALKKLTREYEKFFIDDLKAIGVDVEAITFVRATENIESMQQLIKKLVDAGFAYLADDGIYFSIEKYKQASKKYGQLVEITAQSTGQARVKNDEYDKDNIHDFALWKAQKENEPAWDFDIDGRNMKGRPGWHIECSAMSVKYLGRPFDIHTGGVDLKFPHHENEIAQSTACDGDLLAHLFFHSEHVLVDGKKMSKSLNNFYTLQDVIDKEFNPLAFRLFVLQSSYQNQAHFSWENLQAAQNRIGHWKKTASLLWQTHARPESKVFYELMLNELKNDLETPAVLMNVDQILSSIEEQGLSADKESLELAINQIDSLLGINLKGPDINDEQKDLIAQREEARKNQDWPAADELRAKLDEQGIEINDTPAGPVWYRK